MNRLDLPTNVLKELALKRLEHRRDIMPGLNIQECVDYLQKFQPLIIPPVITTLQKRIERIQAKFKRAA